MYLKNNSNYQCGLGTKKEVLTIKPGEAVHVFDSDIIRINSHLIQITESEFETLNKKEDKKETTTEKTTKQEETKTETEKTEVKESETEPEDRQETEAEALEAELKQLQEQWQNTTNSKKRERLQNKVKEIKAKLDDISRTNG